MPDEIVDDTTADDQTLLTGDDKSNLDADGKPTGDDKSNLDADGKPTGDDTSTADDATGGSGDDKSSKDDDKDNSAPETYADFTMPKEIQLDESLLTAAVPVFKELGLTQDQAQKLVDFQASQVQMGEKVRVDEFNQLKKDWADQARLDTEYGGDKFDENMAVAVDAVRKFGTPELAQLLNDYGVGNHPEVIRFMFKVGKLTQEDNPGSGGENTGAPKDRADILYPNQATA